MNPTCNACRAHSFTEILDLGAVPIAHRFLRQRVVEEEYKHKLAIHICNSCSLIQILDPVPSEDLYRDFNFCFTAWKPQPHMADEISLIKQKIDSTSLIVEIGCNDGLFLNELKKQGLTNVVGIEPNRVSGEIALKTGVPVYNDFFTDSVANQLIQDHGKASLVVARQVVEHIPDLTELLNNINRVLNSEGYILFEVPDFEVPLNYGDCGSLWEEHVNYFTEPVMTNLLNRFGFQIEKIDRFPFSGGALVVLAKKTKNGAPVEIDRSSEIERIRSLALGFKQRVSNFQKRLLAVLEGNRQKGIANFLYGSGCRANALVNGLNVGSYFEFIVDDQPEKQNLFMPGCHLEIKPSKVLSESTGACFLSVNYENEEKVIQKQDIFLKKGGTFYSLNSPSPLLERL